MCAIGWFINYHKTKKIDLDDVKSVFKEMEDRGTDASGFYWERSTPKATLKRMLKAPVPAERMWTKVHETDPTDSDEAKVFKKYGMTGKEYLIMLHTRNKTTGTEQNNDNNMPIFSPNYVLIHNGVITNQRMPGYTYMGEVDSEEILANVETYGIVEGLRLTYGSLSIALRERKGDWLYLARRKHPMELVYFKKRKLLVGVSESTYVSLPLKEVLLTTNLFNPSVAIYHLPVDRLYRVNVHKPEIEFIDMVKENELAVKPEGDVGKHPRSLVVGDSGVVHGD